MKIKSIYIVAFRNIKNAAYTNLDSNGTTIFSGNNMKGKTNTLNAIYWCLTGIDLNGSNDNSLNIPYGEKKANVSIKFDDTTEIERKAILEEGTLSEYLHYEPSKKDIKEHYGKQVSEDEWYEDEEFEEFLTNKYESELTDAIEHGYNDLNDYFEDLKF